MSSKAQHPMINTQVSGGSLCRVSSRMLLWVRSVGCCRYSCLPLLWQLLRFLGTELDLMASGHIKGLRGIKLHRAC